MTTAFPCEIRKAICKKKGKANISFLVSYNIDSRYNCDMGGHDISFSRRLYRIKILVLCSASDFTVFLYKSLPDFYRF